jgi:hypothetical protein
VKERVRERLFIIIIIMKIMYWAAIVLPNVATQGSP